jgi:hypothetical protein
MRLGPRQVAAPDAGVEQVQHAVAAQPLLVPLRGPGRRRQHAQAQAAFAQHGEHRCGLGIGVGRLHPEIAICLERGLVLAGRRVGRQQGVHDDLCEGEGPMPVAGVGPPGEVGFVEPERGLGSRSVSSGCSAPA